MKKMPAQTKIKKYPQNGGFALVIALSLMAFVLLLLLSVSTLTQIELKNAGTSKDKMKAQQNALLAVSLAIGNLQELAGPDTRITAPAEAIATVNGPAQVTGVWRSWEGRDHLTSGAQEGLPIPPDYDSKLDTGELDPDSTQDGRFLGWLSSDALENDDATTPPLLLESDETIPLLSAKILGKNTNREVHIIPTQIVSDETGSYAWWIQGENTKATLKYAQPATTAFDSTTRLATYGSSDPEVFNFQNSPELDQINSRATLDLLTTTSALPDGVQPSGLYFHDLTGRAKGLLTNAATGGWKRDLSLMSEDWDRLSGTNLPFFSLEPGVQTSASKANGTALPPQMLIYPWADPIQDSAAPRRQPGASTTWNNLVDYCLQYRQISDGSSDGLVQMEAFGAGINQASELGNWRDKVRRFPVLARMHWVFSYGTRYDDVDLEEGGLDYTVTLDANPAFTIWNPYNFEITVDSFEVGVEQTVPFTFDFSLSTHNEDGDEVSRRNFGQITMREIVGGSRSTISLLNESGGNTITLQPGETRIFSPREETPVVGRSELDLYPGYRTHGGFRYDNLDPKGNRILGEAEERISVVIVMNADSIGLGGSGSGAKPGIDYSIFDRINNYGSDFREWGQINSNRVQVTLTNPDPFDGPAKKLKLERLELNPDPFLATFISRTGATSEPEWGKGFLNSNPLTFVTYSNQGEELSHRWGFFPMNGTMGGEGVPDSSPDDNGYIGISHQVQEGLTHMIIAEVPLRPLRSLGELQHFDITATNYDPPYVYNALGNSHANPFFEPNAINRPDTAGNLPFLAFDHSYVTNHIFFDDWFVSSIAPETNPWNGSILRSKENVYQDHLSLEEPLPNKVYVPRTPTTSSSAAAQASDDLRPTDAWRNIASELEVEGMFNVNSTSVLAWSSLLRQLRNTEVPSINYSRGAWNVQLDTVSGGETPSSRTTVAVTENFDIGNNPQLGSFRRISDSQITAIAEEIVNQVKLRGPFLSLSEFVNRQLVFDDIELARAGAIEAALLTLSEEGSPSKNPNQEIQNIYSTRTDTDQSRQSFPEAAEGYTAYGYPGWVRQADLLRPLAPILSVRDDTFVIRTYGEQKDPISGNVLSQAWCEAIVQRSAEYVDSRDDKTILPSTDTLSSSENARFGRRFEIVSFRWLSQDEI